jgi:hypothetical protein
VAGEQLNTFNDSSGRVTVGVFRRVGAPAQHHFDEGADPPEDWVAIGGGAVAVEGPPGALLTASYPNGDLTAWLGSSKDHVDPQAHVLTTYAIGMRIAGMSREQLLGAIHISTGDSGAAPHPEATATLPDGFVLVGGGAKVEWTGAGNLLTASFPSTDRSWTARSKDHEESSPANIRAYAIGLRENLPIGRVQAAIVPQDSGAAPHPSAVADMTDGFALTGGGADVHWTGAGNLLWRLEPTTSTANQEFRASAKDHDVPDPSSMTVFALGIRII